MVWGRGLQVYGMSTSEKTALHMRLDTALGNLSNPINEKALIHFAESHVYFALLLPRRRQEVTGLGTERSLGMSKMKLRRETNDEVRKSLYADIVRSVCPRALPTTNSGCRFARRARDYC